MILSPLFVTECYKDARSQRAGKKKRRNNPVTQQLQRGRKHTVSIKHMSMYAGGTCPHNTLGRL